MTIVEATRAYEGWMAQQVAVVRDDVRQKHALMADSPFVFLRGTFYRWAQVFPRVCPSLARAPRVVAIGDLHVENFGTWRDAEGRLVWGVNDLDEAAPLPYTSDLVRLAASAVLAADEERLAISLRRICRAILDGYAASLDHGGRPIVLAERHGWLREIALEELKDPDRFWKKLTENRPAPAVPKALIRLFALPADAVDVRFFRRQAGVGSLGRPRILALAVHRGGLIAREAKAIVLPASQWVEGTTRPRSYTTEVTGRAVRAPDPFFASDSRWTVRRLSPDCLKIEVADLPRRRDDAKLLRAMGWETANIHLATPRVRVKAHVNGLRGRWLERAAADMVDAVVTDYRAWKRHHRRRRKSR